MQRTLVLAELTASVAVVLTLVVLVYEVRENSRALRSATYQGIVASADASYEIQLTDDTLATARMTLINGGSVDDLSELQLAKLHGWMAMTWMHFHNAYLQWTNGMLDERAWESYARQICDLYRTPGEGNLASAYTSADFTAWVRTHCAKQ